MARSPSCIVSTQLLWVRNRHFHFAHPPPQSGVFCTTVQNKSMPSSPACSVSLFSHTYFVGSPGIYHIYILKFLVVCLDRVFSSNRPNSVFHSQSGKTTIFCDCQGNAKIQRVVRVGVVPWCFQDRQHDYVCVSRFWTYIRCTVCSQAPKGGWFAI